MKENIKHIDKNFQDCLEIVEIDDDTYFKISNVDHMPTFFMSIVSDSNHWMFIASNGGLTAGRTNADYSLFPYYTEDKIKDSAEHVGSKTIIQGELHGERYNWEPFSIRSQQFTIERNLYKHTMGNSIIIEEINHDVHMSFSYQWSMSDTFGFIKTSTLNNLSDQTQCVRILDGLQDIMPADVGCDLQNTFSNLVNAYKYSELHQETGLGIYALSARITDRAEPSEALFANTVWSVGFDHPTILLSTKQVDAFRNGLTVQTEHDNKGDRGAYLVSTSIKVETQQQCSWKCIADVHQSQTQVVGTIDELVRSKDITAYIEKDVQQGNAQLKRKVQSVDGIHHTGDQLTDSRHYSNALFNAMRGGVFPDNYSINTKDFLSYIKNCNHPLRTSLNDIFIGLADTFDIDELHALVERVNNQNFTRIALEYLPLTFSRRHGDPSRPWNRFSINTKNPDGSLKYDYQGNWRDIFQNWEALAHSYPLFLEGMIRKFLNASTFDGYNPYRVLKHGFEWETIEDHKPWSYIGYWGDHQIIYLLKLLELMRDTQPERLQALLEMDGFAYAHVPYTIKSYTHIIENPKSTIDFDHSSHAEILKEIERIGSDGALLKNMKGEIHHVHFVEKVLTTIFARIANYVPGGGIWMNTQRPEWNDANNALVGNGISMVTLYYLHRFLEFFQNILRKSTATQFEISNELYEYFISISTILKPDGITDSINTEHQRRIIMDALGNTSSVYRDHIYTDSFSGNKTVLTFDELRQFLHTVLQHLRETITINKRKDGLYHAYNVLNLNSDSAIITHLPKMLEGQVAVLSSGVISPEEAVQVLDALREGTLYREDQQSYMLYPIKTLPRFLEKNSIPKEKVESSPILLRLLENGNDDIIQKDKHGEYHFAGELTNVREFQIALHALEEEYHQFLRSEEMYLMELYESVFHHKLFTGRSGTFFAYEGVGSIYWHMVSKLRYAVQEIHATAIADNANSEVIYRLRHHYIKICEGIGVHKSPLKYGAFPTDPYSHTPLGKGAQQPGMTGQVKEDVICRMRELGVYYSNGSIHFVPSMITENDVVNSDQDIMCTDVHGVQRRVQISSGSLFFTICQTPIVYSLGDKNEVNIFKIDDSIEVSEHMSLNITQSKSIFSRDGQIRLVHVTIDSSSISE